MLMGKTMTSAKIRLFVGDWKFLLPTKNVKAWLHSAKLVTSNCQLKCSAKQINNNHCLNVTIFRIKSANTDKENADRRTIIFKVFIRHFCFFVLLNRYSIHKWTESIQWWILTLELRQVNPNHLNKSNFSERFELVVVLYIRA